MQRTMATTNRRVIHCTIAVLLLFCFLFNIDTTSAQNFQTQSQWLDVQFIDGTPNFRLEFLDRGVPTGVYMTWIYANFQELHTDPESTSIFGTPTSALGGFNTTNGFTQENVTTDYFKAERISHNTSLDVVGYNITYTGPGGLPISVPLEDVSVIPDGMEAEGLLAQEAARFEVFDEPKSIEQGGFKFNFMLRDWPWMNKTDDEIYKLVVTANVTFDAPFDGPLFYNGPGYTQITIGERDYVLNYAKRCSADGVFLEVPEVTPAVAGSDDEARFFTIAFMFPYFADVLIYDPDISPILGGDGDGDDEDDHTMAIAVGVVVPVAVLTVLLILAVVIAAVLWTAYSNKKNRLDKSDQELVNF